MLSIVGETGILERTLSISGSLLLKKY